MVLPARSKPPGREIADQMTTHLVDHGLNVLIFAWLQRLLRQSDVLATALKIDQCRKYPRHRLPEHGVEGRSQERLLEPALQMQEDLENPMKEPKEHRAPLLPDPSAWSRLLLAVPSSHSRKMERQVAGRRLTRTGTGLNPGCHRNRQREPGSEVTACSKVKFSLNLLILRLLHRPSAKIEGRTHEMAMALPRRRLALLALAAHAAPALTRIWGGRHANHRFFPRALLC